MSTFSLESLISFFLFHQISESTTGLQRRKRQSSITSNDLIASGVSTKYPSVDQAIDSAGFITDKTFSGTSGIGYPFDGPPGRERSRVSSATGFPAREQHLRARDEAGLARPHPPSMSQLRAEPDRRRSREQHSSGHLRRDERDTHLGLVYQDVSLPRDRHTQVSPDQHRGVFTSQGHLYARPDQYGFGSFDSDQLDLLYPSAYVPGMVPISVDQVGVMLPGMDEQELVLAGMAQSDAVPPVVPGRDQPGSEQPSTDHPGTVLLSTYQLPGMDESGVGPLGTYQSGVEPLGVDQHGFVIYPMDQQVFVQPSLGTSGFIQPGTEQHEMIQPGAGQAGVVQPGVSQPGVVQPGAGQAGAVQPGAAQAGVVQPGVGQAGMVQPGAGQPGLVQPQVDQYGLVQPDRGQHGFFQPNISMPGLVPPGAYPPGLVQTGAYPGGLIQPGAYPRGFMQPGADQQGLVQPVIDPRWGRQSGTGRSIIPPGTELLGLPTYRADSQSFTSPRPYQQGVAAPGRDQYGRVSSLLASQGLTPSGTDREGLVLREMYRQGLLQRGPTPLSTAVGSAPQDQQHLGTSEPEQHDQAVPDSIPDSQGLMYGGPGYQGVDQQVQVGLGPKELYVLRQPGVSVPTSPSQEAPFPRSTHSLDSLNRGSSERSDTQSERRESLDKLAPSFPIAVETFRMMGEIIALYMELKENIKDLDEEQAGQTDLEKIQYLLALMGGCCMHRGETIVLLLS